MTSVIGGSGHCRTRPGRGTSHRLTRTIAATFADPDAAQAARHRLESEVHAERVEVATAAVSETMDGPIDRARTIVAVRVDGDAPTAREVLMAAGGQLVADVELDRPGG